MCGLRTSGGAGNAWPHRKIQALPDAGMVTLTYHVQLKMPLTLPGCGEQLTAIPARSVIGCLAGAYLRQGTAADAAFRQLFLDGTARWSPLTPGDRRGSFLPSSACAGLPEKRWCIC